MNPPPFPRVALCPPCGGHRFTRGYNPPPRWGGKRRMNPPLFPAVRSRGRSTPATARPTIRAAARRCGTGPVPPRSVCTHSRGRSFLSGSTGLERSTTESRSPSTAQPTTMAAYNSRMLQSSGIPTCHRRKRTKPIRKTMASVPTRRRATLNPRTAPHAGHVHRAQIQAFRRRRTQPTRRPQLGQSLLPAAGSMTTPDARSPTTSTGASYPHHSPKARACEERAGRRPTKWASRIVPRETAAPV